MLVFKFMFRLIHSCNLTSNPISDRFIKDCMLQTQVSLTMELEHFDKQKHNSIYNKQLHINRLNNTKRQQIHQGSILYFQNNFIKIIDDYGILIQVLHKTTPGYLGKSTIQKLRSKSLKNLLLSGKSWKTHPKIGKNLSLKMQTKTQVHLTMLSCVFLK